MSGTFASFARVLALQTRQIVSTVVQGNSFSNVEINMDHVENLFMSGAIVFHSSNGDTKSCYSELRRIAGKLYL